MMTLPRILTVILLLVIGTAPVAGIACESAGPNTHVGVVTAVDPARQSLSLKDAESGKVLTFVAGPDLLEGIAVRDPVMVVYAAEGQTLRAKSIKKS